MALSRAAGCWVVHDNLRTTTPSGPGSPKLSRSGRADTPLAAASGLTCPLNEIQMKRWFTSPPPSVIYSNSRSAPLYRDAGRVADLDPGGVRAGPVGRVDAFRNDALGTKPAGVIEHGGPVLSDMLIEQDPRLAPAYQPRQSGLALERADGSALQLAEHDWWRLEVARRDYATLRAFEITDRIVWGQ